MRQSAMFRRAFLSRLSGATALFAVPQPALELARRGAGLGVRELRADRCAVVGMQQIRQSEAADRPPFEIGKPFAAVRQAADMRDQGRNLRLVSRE